MTEAETAARRSHESLSTGNATLADEVPTPGATHASHPTVTEGRKQ